MAATAALTLAMAGPAAAQESSYNPGTVWQFSNIQIEPGQFEKYVDYLAGNWRKINEFGKKEGMVVSYHVFTVNNRREGEPDLILAVEYKDYFSNAPATGFPEEDRGHVGQRCPQARRCGGRTQGDAQIERRHGTAGAAVQVMARGRRGFWGVAAAPLT